MKYFKIIFLLLIVVVSCKKEEKFPIEVKKYHENENLKEFYYLDKDSLRTKIRKTFYKSGKIETEAEMSLDKINGVYKSYYENGTLMLEGKFENDLPNGSIRMFHENGKLNVELMYHDNKIIEDAIFYDEKSRVSFYKNYNNLGDLRYRLTLDTLGNAVSEKGDKIASVGLNVKSGILNTKQDLEIFLEIANPPSCKEIIYTRLNGATKDSTTISAIKYDYKLLPTKLGNNKLEIFIDYECEDYQLKSDYFLVDFLVE